MIEFKEGEGWCRWNGKLMSPENYERMFGISMDDEPVIEDDVIECGDYIYSDLPFGKLLTDIIKCWGTHHGAEPDYDPVPSQGYGFRAHCAAKEIECSYVIPDRIIPMYENLQLKPMKAFKKDHPKFKREKFLQYFDELNDYYEKRVNR